MNIKNINKINYIKEEPIFVLEGGSGYADEEDVVEIYLEDIKKAKIGQEWIAHNPSNCGRSKYEELLKVIYKDNEGALLLHKRWGTTDSPSPEYWETDPEFYYIEFRG